MTYQIEFKPSAKRTFSGLSKEIQARLDRKILALADNPRPRGSKKLTGKELFRVKVGKYRVVYAIQNVRLVVLVVRIGQRKDVYRGL